MHACALRMCVYFCVYRVFFFKQKTAYEMRISDWSSDVCSSDLTTAFYDYCPLPRVVYPDLDNELYCDSYYLRNLCNEQKFPEWPIRSPIDLLKAPLESWQEEMAKGMVDRSVMDARKLMDMPIGRASCRERVCK